MNNKIIVFSGALIISILGLFYPFIFLLDSMPNIVTDLWPYFEPMFINDSIYSIDYDYIDVNGVNSFYSINLLSYALYLTLLLGCFFLFSPIDPKNITLKLPLAVFFFFQVSDFLKLLIGSDANTDDYLYSTPSATNESTLLSANDYYMIADLLWGAIAILLLILLHKMHTNTTVEKTVNQFEIEESNLEIGEFQSFYIEASKGVRFLHFLIDLAIIQIAVYSIQSFFNSPFVLLIVSIVLRLFYYIIFETVFQATPAKFITRTQVLKLDNSNASFSDVFLRTLSRLVPFEVFSFLGDSNNGWHDKWTKTKVVIINQSK